MDSIKKEIILKFSRETAFEKFLTGFNDWWHKEYTWSKDSLKEISIGLQAGSLCTEIGPNGFRIDWGTVINIQKDNSLSFKWQIGSNREPIPNPEKASLVTVTFNPISNSETKVELTHSDFKSHGDNYLEYLKAMDSNQGWEYLLNRYKEYAMK